MPVAQAAPPGQAGGDGQEEEGLWLQRRQRDRTEKNTFSTSNVQSTGVRNLHSLSQFNSEETGAREGEWLSKVTQLKRRVSHRTGI